MVSIGGNDIPQASKWRLEWTVFIIWKHFPLPIPRYSPWLPSVKFASPLGSVLRMQFCHTLKVVNFGIFISCVSISILSCLTNDVRECTIRKGFSESIERCRGKLVPPLPSWLLMDSCYSCWYHSPNIHSNWWKSWRLPSRSKYVN